MTPFRWVLLCILFTLYLLLGGSIFMLIEQHHEIHQKEELHVLRQDIQEILFRLDHNFYDNLTSPDVLDALTSAKEGVINRIAAVCGIDNLLDNGRPVEPSSLKWNYYNSVFFAFTVVTTIGYGHLSPSTSLSKSLMMVYALVGIPLNGILLSGVGDYFSNKLVKVHQKSKEKRYRGKSLTLFFEIVFYLIPGIVVFIIIPAGVFVLIENWTFLDSVYFAFVSLTTIGFGDYVAGMGDGHSIWSWLYKAFIIIWITFGLGYLIMILGFIAKGMKSKKVRGVLEKRLIGIRNTKEKLSKDIDYMRRIVNELYLMKIKPVYDVDGAPEEEGQGQAVQDEKFGKSGEWIRPRGRRPSCVHFERRCNSLPRLPLRDEEYRLERSLSPETCSSGVTLRMTDSLDGVESVRGTNHAVHSRGLVKRRLSESDATNVERDEGFLELLKGCITPEKLLVHVVNALNGNMKNVMEAVDELNKYEQEVEDEDSYGEENESPVEESDDHGMNGRRKSQDVESGLANGESSKFQGPAAPTSTTWESHLRAVSESDEEILLDGDRKVKENQPQDVLVHKPEDLAASGPSQTLLEKVTDAFRKISGTSTPPESPSRKISRNESERKRKISRLESSSGVTLHPNPHNYNQLYSPFTQRTHRRSQHSTPEGERKHYAKHGSSKESPDTRRTSSLERKISSLSNTSYQTIDEIMSSYRASRKTTPAHYHPSSPVPPPAPSSEDEVDTGGNLNSSMGQSGRMSLETSTSSLASFLKALDSVQDRLQKSSVCSDASFSGSYYPSDHDSVDFSNSFSPNPGARTISSSSRPKRSVTPTESVFDRRRKNGVFHPGFSYVNFGYNPEDDDDDVTVMDAMGRVVTRRRLPEDDQVHLTEGFSKSKKR